MFAEFAALIANRCNIKASGFESGVVSGYYGSGYFCAYGYHLTRGSGLPVCGRESFEEMIKW